MSDGVLAAIIALAGSGLGSLGGVLISNKLTNYRIEQLEKKVEKHNNVIDRTYKLESEVVVIKNDMKVANHRIKDLEEEGNS